jgi:diguanylate cyclase (GGDEF)-like protein/PAS domain S-box-containing protein
MGQGICERSIMVVIVRISDRPRGTVREGAGSRGIGVSMPSMSRNMVKQAALPTALKGQEGRTLPLRVLFVHSNPAQVERCLQELRKVHFKVSADVVLTRQQFAQRLKTKYYDVALVEYPTPNWQGPRALNILRLMDKQIPCVFLTETVQLETTAELMTGGAADCVAMDYVGHLPIAIRRALSENNLRNERDQTEKKLRHSEARYRALVGNLTYGMCRCSDRGVFLNVNQALVTMLGYNSQKELLATNHAADVLCDPAKRAQLLGHSNGQPSADSLEIEWKRKDGTMLKVRLSGREVSNEGEKESYEIIVEDVTQQRKLEDNLRQQAAKDPLTGLSNYRHLVETVDSEIKRSERTKRQFALLFLDLDGLKQINDSFGHLVGSRALCRLADVLCMCSRNLDTAARFGGDEFALVMPETGKAQAALVALRVCENLSGDGREPKLSVSIGVAVYPKDGEKVETLLEAADAALYSVKVTKGTKRGKHVGAKAKSEITQLAVVPAN